MRLRLLSMAVLVSLLMVSLASRGVRSEPATVAEELHAQAAARGTVRVIVRLNAPFVPEGHLGSAAHVTSQRQMLSGVQATVRSQLQGVRHRVVRQFGGQLPLMAIEASPEALQMLASLRGVVAAVYEDHAFAPSLAQSIPLINANDVWNAGFDGTGQIVAILDTGVQKDHAYFAAGGGKVIAEACFSSNGVNISSACPGGVEFSGAAGSGLPCTLTGCNHGTHVAGTAAGAGATSSGVAKGAKIIAIQVFSQFGAFHPSCPSAAPCVLSFISDQLEALNYVHAQRLIFPGHRIAAVNISIGGGEFLGPCDSDPIVPDYVLAIDQLRAPHPTDPIGDRGVATVISAGNNGLGPNGGFTDALSAPACISSAIPVASSTKSDVVSSFSNMASPTIFPNILFAPGSSISAPVPPGPDNLGVLSGTSMAAPHVAGAFAVLREIEPTASVDSLITLLKNTGRTITDTRTPCPVVCAGGFSAPRIDLLAAAAFLAPPNLVVQTLTAPTAGIPGANISVTTSVRNIGIGQADASNVKIYLSSDNTITTGDTLLGTIAVPSLNGSVTSPGATLTMPIPLATTPGVYFIGAIADADGQADETSEADNTKAFGPVQIALPDLTVTTIAATPGAIAPGLNVSVTHTVKNLAAAPGHAPASTSRLYLSSDALFGSDVSLGTVAVPALTAGASMSVTKSVTIPGNTSAGQYWIFAAANDGGTFTEPGTSNNTLGTSTPILVGPDLLVTAATAAPLATAPGMNVSITNTVKNQGGAAAGAFDVGFYLSSDNVFGGDTLLATRRVTGLGAGLISTATTPVTIPSNFSAATYFVIVRADTAGTPGEVVEANEGNNERATAAIQVVKADLTVLSVTAPAVMAPGMNVSVSHVVKNLAPAAGKAPGSTSRLYLSTDATLEVGSDTVLGDAPVGALAGLALATVPRTVTIPGVTAPGQYWIFAQANFNGVVQEADSPTLANNVKGTTAPILVGPDLLVTAATAAPLATAPGMNVSITNTVKNQGGAAAGAFDVGFYLSSDNVFGGDTLLATRRVTGLGAGLVSTATTPVTIPSNFSAATYFVIVRADTAGTPGEVVEANEGNNERATAAIQVVKADLTVLSVTAPAVMAPGMNVSVSHVVKNLAPAAGKAPGSTSRLYLSTDATLEVGSDTVLGDAPVGALAGLALATVAKTVTIPGVTAPGQYWIIAQANATNVVQESDSPTQANNIRATATPVLVGADLLVTAATAAPLATAPGMNVSITNTIKNLGGAPTGAFDVGFYLSTDNVFGGDLLLTTRRVSMGLAAGALSTAMTPVTIPSNFSPATYFVIVRADPNAEVSEANEGNNLLATAGIQVVRPNLTVLSVTAPAFAAPGMNVSVSHVVKNLALPAGAAPSSTSRLYLSADGTLDVGDVELGDATVGALAGGALATVPKTVTIPGGTAAGKYWVFAQANFTGVVQEADSPTLANNVTGTAKPIFVGPDLITTAATVAPVATAPGKTVNLTRTVKNQGAQASGPFDVGVYLSTDNTFGGDALLTTGRVSPGLLPGATFTGVFSVPIPSNLSTATYFLIVRADSAGTPGEVVEADETNNTRATVGIQVVRPDLSVTAVTAPAVTAPGANVSVSHVVKNLAPAAGGAPSSTSRLYLSTDAILDVGSDTALVDATVVALAGGAMATMPRTVTIPGGTAPGLYWIIAQANATNTVLEADSPGQANNVKATAAPILVGPDLVVTALTTTTTLASPNFTFPVTTTVKNQGGQAASGSVVRFFLNTSNTLDLGSPVPMGVTATATLAPGASVTRITRLTVPANTSVGSYFVLAQADGSSPVVPEANETNNVRATAAAINVQLPNLQIISLAPPSASIRGKITGAPAGSVVVKNTGLGPSAPFVVQVFANRDDGSPGAQDPGTGDVIFTRAVPMLAPNAQTTVSGPVIVPEGTLPDVRLAGNYYMSAIADAAGVTMDPSTGNNAMTWLTKKIPVLPDMTKLQNAAVNISLTPDCGIATLTLDGPFSVTNQTLANPSNFAGTVVLTDNVGGSGFVQRYNVTGNVQAVDVGGTAGRILSSFTYTATIANDFASSGSGSINGAAPALNFTGGSISGQQSGLPTCTFTGSIDIVR